LNYSVNKLYIYVIILNRRIGITAPIVYVYGIGIKSKKEQIEQN